MVLKQKSEACAVDPISVGMADLSIPTMSSQPRSMRWCATDDPVMPPKPMITTFAFAGNFAIFKIHSRPAVEYDGVIRRCGFVRNN